MQRVRQPHHSGWRGEIDGQCAQRQGQGLFMPVGSFRVRLAVRNAQTGLRVDQTGWHGMGESAITAAPGTFVSLAGQA